MILLTFVAVIFTGILLFLMFMRIQAKMGKMVGGKVTSEKFEFSMVPLPGHQVAAVPTMEPVGQEELGTLARQLSGITSDSQVIPTNLETACFIHLFDDDNHEVLVKKLYALTNYITTPFSKEGDVLLGDLVVINIATESSECMQAIQRLLLLNNRKYMRLFFICRNYSSKPLPTFKPYANQLTTFRLPFLTYGPIEARSRGLTSDQQEPTDPPNSIYYGPSNIYTMPAVYIEPKDENVICMHYTRNISQ